ncbi:MAG: glycosyltransferase [Planctomycetaceae bacterium]|nr:glycosyltransferase [Planctomycetaceae bacterium]
MDHDSRRQRALKIAFCITELDIGGAERCLVELACGLDRARFVPAVYVLGNRPRPPHDALFARLEDARIPVTPLFGRSAIDAPRIAWLLSRALRRTRPDLLQTFLWHAGMMGRVAARRAHVPRVVTGIRVAEQRGRRRLWLDRWTDRWVDCHVAVSDAVAQFSIDKGGLPASKVEVIPNGVDLSRYAAVRPADLTEWGVPAGARAIVCIGRLDPQKRVDWLLHAVAHAFKGAHDCHLLVVGEGPEREALERLVKQLGLERRVHLLGFRRDVPEILAACELLVHASAWEGMPNVVLEAMASARAVVATDVEGVRELLGPAAISQVTPVDAPRQFTEKLLALLSDAPLRAQLGAANHARAGEYSLQRMIARYAELYERLCAKR